MNTVKTIKFNDYIDTPEIRVKETRFGEVMYTWKNYHNPKTSELAGTVFWVAFHKQNGQYMIGYKFSHQAPAKWVEYGEGDILEAIEKYLYDK